MHCVANDTMTLLSEMKSLKYVYREGLSNVTDISITELVANSKALHTLLIKNCTSIPKSVTLYAKRTINTVIHVADN